MTTDPDYDPAVEAGRITNRWREDLAFSPPEMEAFRWHLITQELTEILEEAND